MEQIPAYIPKNKIRIVTAASLFDGHDAAINIMRRIIQATGVEVIHLGHDRSVEEVVNTAIQEDANAIAITSYQGGHNEYFKYMYDLLQEKGASQIKIFGGGGGVILPEEIKELMDYGITRIYSPDDGRTMGLQGMINDMVKQSDVLSLDLPTEKNTKELLEKKHVNTIARLISIAENNHDKFKKIIATLKDTKSQTPVLGITGTGGAGKSSLVDELVRRFLHDFPTKTLAIVSVDPSKRKTGGALLGDRIRMNAINNDRVYMRSLATRRKNAALSKHVFDAIQVLKLADYDFIILESSGIGQSDTEILDYADVSLYVMTPEYGAATQLEKIDMLDFADVIALNKFDKRGGLDALRAVKKQYQRNHNLFDKNVDTMPVYGTIASQFNDLATTNLYRVLLDTIAKKTNVKFDSSFAKTDKTTDKAYIIPPKRIRYLSEIVENNASYDQWVLNQKEVAQKLFGIFITINSIITIDSKQSLLIESGLDGKKIIQSTQCDTDKELVVLLLKEFDKNKKDLDPHNWDKIRGWRTKKQTYKNEVYSFKVRDKVIDIPTHTESLSFTKIPKISLPKYEAWGDVLAWILQENVPGEFPLLQGFIPLNEQEKTPHACLLVKEDPNAPIDVFTTLV